MIDTKTEIMTLLSSYLVVLSYLFLYKHNTIMDEILVLVYSFIVLFIVFY